MTDMRFRSDELESVWSNKELILFSLLAHNSYEHSRLMKSRIMTLEVS